ncbi:hypothetical protein PFICI_07826 [Pestalotiopsis fici W106-1]|uniref:Oxidoreductase AflY n=1 Tax=Pestalotiopsis fici (strain W106-1 / CGMCC3.15140) TaxID=1229662 RepID=W3X4J4_PESFW|nr:uncharacterized protein PFICI_07826 [Pestalotiopsis fici W106-1]ETS80297.1 hypothetical protein PFICI_07826 [Pestalotiopsis fici W106-1]
MATPYAVKITPENTGLWHFDQTEAAANKATELLTKDIEKHHVFFNDDGFHNHISHQILALYGTGASAQDLVSGYKENEGYQRPAMKAHSQTLIDELRDWEKAKKRLGKGQYYTDWLHFFQHEIEHHGSWQKVLAEYMFKENDARSEDMQVRMFAGFVHPLIQLMYGVEWDQPAIVAMALAQACVHSDQFHDFMMEAETRAHESATTPMPRIGELLRDAAADRDLVASPRLDDGNKVRDGVLARARDSAMRLAARVRVMPEELEERTAEMYNAAIYIASAAALHHNKNGGGEKDPKYEFFLMHHVNVNPIFITLNRQDWIPMPLKVRLLEWKIRMDLIQYTARGSPDLDLDRIRAYVPTASNPGPAAALLPRMHAFVDDGHAIKLFRAIGIGREVSKPYEHKEWMIIKGDLWDQIAHMVVDSVEAPGPTWVRNAGFDEAWQDVRDRQNKKAVAAQQPLAE